MDKPKRRPFILQAAGYLMMGVLAFMLVAGWFLIGAISGLKPPFTIMGVVFEGGYTPEPGFMSTLTAIVTTIVGALGGWEAKKAIAGPPPPEPPPVPPAPPQKATCPICDPPKPPTN